MKNTSKILLMITLVLLMTFSLSSCLFLASGYLSDENQDADTGEYMTREEVEALISGIEQNVTVQGGDSFNVNINADGEKNLVAASKGLLSAVSIKCNFKITTTYPPTWWTPGSTNTEDKQSAGSGVIYQLDKAMGSAYIITNYHVVYLSGSDTANDISDNITVNLYGQESDQYAIPAEYVGGSPNYDIAVLRVKNSDVIRSSNAMAATFANSNDVAILDTAIAIGNPENFGLSATVGAVNVESEDIVMTSIDETGYIQLRVIRTDAAVNGGNSGGGLFNDEGNVIGIVNAKMSDSTIDNIAYAIPSNVAKYVADNIIFYDNQDPANDRVYRAMIGIGVDIKSSGTNYDAESGRVTKYEEVMIKTVESGSAADGKLAVGDVIKSLTVDGKQYEVVRTYNVIDIMLTARKTSSVIFTVIRDGNEVTVEFDMSTVELVAY